MSEDCWGPWIDHVPGPCPVPVGAEIEIEIESGARERCTVSSFFYAHFVWRLPANSNHPIFWSILRYRVRIEPQREHSGMAILRKTLKGIPIKETADA